MEIPTLRTFWLFGQVLLLLAIAGCATYENYDYYAPVDADKKSVSELLSSRDFYRFSPLQGVTALGPVGIPLVPVSIPNRAEVLELEVHFELNENRAFSMLKKPCIESEDSELICAEKFSFFGFAESNIPKPITRKLLDARTAESIGGGARVTNLDLFKQTAFEFTPTWHWLVLGATYEFRCNKKCPPSFQFNPFSLLEVDGISKFNATVKFHRKTREKYTALANPTN